MGKLSLFALFLALTYSLAGQRTCYVDTSLVQQGLPVRITLREELQVQVVVHIVWRDITENISDAQIHSQIDALNRDFNQTNLMALPKDFQHLAAQVNIHFCLASIDPQGFPSTGITRTQTSQEAIGIAIAPGQRQAIHYSNHGGQDGWPPDKYINIWVGNLAGLYGRASMPGGARHPEEDGLVIDTRYFGMVGRVAYPYHLGRTLVHEMGHYLGLDHPWGAIQNECIEDDGISDTPPQLGPHLGCPPHPQPGCFGPAMFMNFMELGDDPCLLAFTAGQVAVMRQVLMEVRSGLLSNKCINQSSSLTDTSFKILHFPTSRHLVVHFLSPLQSSVNVEFFNIQGQRIFSYQSPHQWTGIIPISEEVTGFYFIVLRQAGNVVTKKVFIP